MSQKHEVIARLRDQEEALRTQIESLRHEADASSTAGIREFRKTRLEQLNTRQSDLNRRLDRLASSEDDVWDKVHTEAEVLYAELKDVAMVAANTFH